MVELAVTIDLDVPFVKMMYNLECDGPLALTCYETISALNAAARQAHYPNLTTIASQIASGDSQMEGELIQHAKSVWAHILLPAVGRQHEGTSSHL